MAEVPDGFQGTLSGLPEGVERWLDALVNAIGACLGTNLEGVYLHGSLAMGSFFPESSDVDLLLAVEAPPMPRQIACLRDLLLLRSGKPYAVELSVMARAERFPWRHPSPFSWHYSEHWRAAMAAEAAGSARAPLPATDHDLAAHLTMLRARGRVLRGAPIDAAFPEVPRGDFLDAVFTRDEATCLRSLRESPLDGILNLCRLGLYACEGRLASKREGASWALAEPRTPEPAMVRRALQAYEAGEEGRWENQELRRFGRAFTRAVGRWLGEEA